MQFLLHLQLTGIFKLYKLESIDLVRIKLSGFEKYIRIVMSP